MLKVAELGPTRPKGLQRAGRRGSLTGTMTCFLRSTHALMPGRMGAWEALHAFAEGRQSDPWNGWSELVGIRLASVKTSALCAYGAAAIFLILFVAFPGGSPAAVYRVPEIAAHLLLFPVVAALPAASWARASSTSI